MIPFGTGTLTETNEGKGYWQGWDTKTIKIEMFPFLRMAITYISPWGAFEGHLVNFLILLTERSRIRKSVLFEVGHISVNSKMSRVNSLVYKLRPVTRQWPKIRYFSLPGSCKESIVQKGEIVMNDMWQSASCTPRQM